MLELSVIRDLVAIFSFLIGLTYYIMNLRNQEKARQIQLVYQLGNTTTRELQIEGTELFAMTWTDYDDFEHKYGSANNPENYGMRYEWWSMFNQIGVLVKIGLIDIETLYRITGGTMGIVWQWNKFGEIIKKQRELYHLPDLFAEFEYLVDEMVKYQKKKGREIIIPENYDRYSPDT